MQLSKYFTLEEMIASQTAARKRIDNTPTSEHVQNMVELCHLADKVREYLGHPMIVSSGYRGAKLNTAIGGSKTSAHMRGEAMDFTCPGFGSVKEVFNALKSSGIAFDQLILEYPDANNGNGSWVHLGISSTPRHQTLVFDGTQYRIA